MPRDKWLGAKAFYAKLALRPRPAFTPEDLAAYQAVNMYKLNTSVARYVWLPIRFLGDRPMIEWQDEWRVEDFD